MKSMNAEWQRCLSQPIPATVSTPYPFIVSMDRHLGTFPIFPDISQHPYCKEELTARTIVTSPAITPPSTLLTRKPNRHGLPLQ